MRKGKGKAWAMCDGGYMLCDRVDTILPPGYYEPNYGVSISLVPHDLKTDELFQLPGSVSKRIIGDMDEFWASEKRFRAYGLLWKRGILLYGPPGTGKTCAVELVCNRLIEQEGGIEIFGNRGIADLEEALEMVREAEPDRKIVVVLEDIDRLVEHHESELSSVLDGEKQVDNIVFLATTNHLDKLPTTLTKRPSRFDLLHEVPMPGAKARRWYLKKKLGGKIKKVAEMNEAVRGSDGFSFAHLKELSIRILVFEYGVDAALESVREML